MSLPQRFTSRELAAEAQRKSILTSPCLPPCFDSRDDVIEGRKPTVPLQGPGHLRQALRSAAYTHM